MCLAWALPAACGAPWETELFRGVKIRHSDAISLGRDAQSEALRDLERIRSARPFPKSLPSVPPACSVCGQKDYSDGCPLHWLEVDGRCQAPASYSGFCNQTLPLVGLTGEAKQEVEVICSVCWPCNDSCERDYSLPCPNGYASKTISLGDYGDASGDACVAISETECEYEMSFRDAVEKESFSRRCATSWPCVSTCSASTCPIDWVAIGDGLCVAPRSYKKEGCSLVLEGVLEWSRSKKIDFAKECGVRWRCVDEVEFGAPSKFEVAHRGGGRAPNRVDLVDGPI